MIFYSPPESSFGSGNLFDYGTTATLTCNEGFVLVGGDAVRTCGDEGEWSGDELNCDRTLI